MRKTIHNRIKQAKTWDQRLFWRVYAVEQDVSSILAYRVDLPNFKSFAAAIMIFSLLLATLPGVVSANVEADASLPRDLETINPIVRTIAHDEAIEDATEKEDIPLLTLPGSQLREPAYTKKVVVTFYSSTPDQTDSTPFITANGTHVRDGIVATNALRFGTRVTFPDLFGDKVFVVHDRMNRRYTDRMDIWVETRAEALQRGKAYTTLEVY